MIFIWSLVKRCSRITAKAMIHHIQSESSTFSYILAVSEVHGEHFFLKRLLCFDLNEKIKPSEVPISSYPGILIIGITFTTPLKYETV